MQEPLMVGVVGGGLMGSGIAAKLAACGLRVTVFDSAPGAGERVRAACAAAFGELVDGGAMDPGQADAAHERVGVASELRELADAGVVFEAIFESLDAKRSLYRDLEAILAPKALIASTTSGFTPASLFEGLRHGDRALVAHFWNPPHLIPLVEVLASGWTAESAVECMMRLLGDCGCSPVRLHKAVPGFIGNRIQFAVLREALHLLHEGVADAETIDLVVRQTLGRRYRWIGPLEVADAGGLDTFLQIAGHLMPQLAKGEEVLEVLARHVARGEKGRLSGQGLMTWNDARRQRYREIRLRMMEGR